MVSMLIPAHGGPQRREAEALRELAIACMQEDPEQHPERESICRVVTSGTGRAPVRRAPGTRGALPGLRRTSRRAVLLALWPQLTENVAPIVLFSYNLVRNASWRQKEI